MGDKSYKPFSSSNNDDDDDSDDEQRQPLSYPLTILQQGEDKIFSHALLPEEHSLTPAVAVLSMLGGSSPTENTSVTLISHTPNHSPFVDFHPRADAGVRFNDIAQQQQQPPVRNGNRDLSSSGMVAPGEDADQQAWEEWVEWYKKGLDSGDPLGGKAPAVITSLLQAQEGLPRPILDPITQQVVETPPSTSPQSSPSLLTPAPSFSTLKGAPLSLPASSPRISPLSPSTNDVPKSSDSAHSSSSPPPSELHFYPNSRGNSGSSLPSMPIPNSQPGDLLEFFKKNGYFPSPPGEFEEERLATIKKYGLDKPERQEAIERACRIAKNYFKTSTVLVTLLLEHEQVLNAEIGWSSVDPTSADPLTKTPLISSLCRHGILKSDPKSLFIVPDASKDWRFRGSPYAIANGGKLASYVGASINLPAASTQSTEGKVVPATLPVGSICLINNKPRTASFSEIDRTVLLDLADMVAREFQHGFEQKRRNAEANQANFLGTFLNTTLIQPTFLDNPTPVPTKTQTTPTEMPERPPPSVTSHASGSGSSSSHIKPPMFQHASQELCALTGTHSAAVLDLRSFRAPPPVSPRSMPTEMFGSANRRRESIFERTAGSGMGSIGLLGTDGNVDWESIVNEDLLKLAVTDALTSYYTTGLTEYNLTTEESPLAAVLPHVTSSTYVRPVFDVDGTPALLLVLTSEMKRFRLDAADMQFVENVGAVMLSSLLRQRALEADRAKLAFVGSVSHELRTPLHGITSQIELIREFSSASQLMKLTPFLDTADVCLEALRDVLDDTLHLAKLDNTSAAEAKELQQRSMSRGDLALIAEHITKATWVRKKRVDLVSADSQAQALPTPTPDHVKVILEVQNRPNGWGALLDIGGMKRVLLNLLGNSLKFTTVGFVKLSIAELPHKSRSGLPVVSIEIEDTGRGMSEEFLREKLFTPFVQEDSFAQGAGLGMSIVHAIVQRMGGKLNVVSELGKGTKMTILLPIEFLSISPETTPQTTPNVPSTSHFAPEYSPGVQTRVISEELSTLFNPGPAHVLLTTPVSERGFDFSQAVEAAQNSFGPKLGRIPSRKYKRSGAGATDAERQELVIEAAKLSLANAPVTLGQSPPAFPDWKLQPSPTTPRRMPEASPFLPEQASFEQTAKVIIADDNPIARNILSKLLAGKGISFVSAEDGIQAFEKYKAHSPGDHIILILDLQMPRATGLEASHMIRDYEKQQGLTRSRILILSGLNEQDRNLNSDGPHDSWVVKGGKSLRIVLDEIEAFQKELNGLVEPESPLVGTAF